MLELQRFLPFSLAGDIHLKRAAESHETYLFKISKIDQKKRSLIVSRKEYIEAEREKVWAKISEQYKEGDVVKGKVARFVEFGAFIDIGGFEGLLHKNDFTWKKAYKRKDIIEEGKEYDFKILAINLEGKKVSLGLKQLSPDPWNDAVCKYVPGVKVVGTVVTVTNFGIFIEIEDGIEGFVGLNDFSWTKKAAHPQELFHRGDAINAVVVALNKDERRISLGIKQLLPNPWDSIEKRFPIGSVHTRPVKNTASFGIFVSLDDDIDGLIHISDISWDENIKDISAQYKAGDMLTFKILEIKKSEMRISCGIKQLEKSPWDKVKEQFPVRSKISGTVTQVLPFGLVVSLGEGAEGFVHISEASRKKIEKLDDIFKVGETVNTVVLGVDTAKRKLSLSIKSFDIIVEKEELTKFMKGSSTSSASIGDIIKLNKGSQE